MVFAKNTVFYLKNWKSHNFSVFFIWWFCQWKFIQGNLNLRCIMLSNVNSIYIISKAACDNVEIANGKFTNISEVKFSQIIVNVQYYQQHLENIWATTWQNQQNECAPSEDSNQSGHPPSLIRVFAVCMKKAWVLSYILSAQRRLWSDWADDQADLSLRWAHTRFVGFVMSRLI